MFTWMNPFPTMLSEQMLQKKHSLCQARDSKATNLVLPSPPFPEKVYKLSEIGTSIEHANIVNILLRKYLNEEYFDRFNIRLL